MKSFSRIAIAAAALTVASLSQAAALVPSFDNFGANAPSNDFASPGMSISTDNVAMTSYDGGNGALFLSATPRYSSPALTNDGKGTFHAATGGNGEGNTFGRTNLAQWNFDFEINRGETDYTYKLFVDLDAGLGTDLSQYAVFTMDPSASDSSNLGFFSTLFNPNADGEYGFMLAAFDDAGLQVADVSILVDVGNPTSNVPEPAGLALVGIALAGAGFASRRRKA
ncbi:MAG TPA: PEP-CTERM sorting domain-containing protein [Burkholderiaceae bacterium]|jgi:hypothetical protein